MRTIGSNRDTTAKAIREAAIENIAKHGFKAASLRLIAKTIGMQAGSLYNYIKSKESFLFDLLRDHLESLIAQYRERTKGVTDPYQRLLAFIDIHLDFHIDRRLEVFIGNMELRNLSRPHYKVVTGLRDAYTNILRDIIEDGVKSGIFSVPDTRVTAFATISMLSGVCTWYRPDGRMSKKDIVEAHTKLAFAILGMKDAAKRSRP